MQSEWRDCTLGGFVRLQRGHDLTASEQQPGAVPVMGSAGPNGTHSEARAKGPGVAIGRSGASIGRVHFSGVDYWPHNTCLYVTDFLGNNPRFAYYLLKTLDLAGYNSGSAQPSLNRNYIYRMKMRVPQRDEQDRIVAVLQAIDHRIDLLRQTNATLESIAQALFKSWFIDFDPVRAKTEGRMPEGMDAATAALFPAEFEESALGLIPKGWRIGTVEDLFVLQRGFDLPTSQRTDGPFIVFAASGPHGHHHEPMVRGPGVVTGRSGVIGRVFFSHEDFWPLNTSLWVKQFKAATAPYAYQYLQTMNLSRLNAGSAVPTLNRNHVHAQLAVVPRAELVDAYTAVATPLLQRIRGNELKSAVLAELRDVLLPRLVSGKLRLPGARAQIEDAVTT